MTFKETNPAGPAGRRPSAGQPAGGATGKAPVSVSSDGPAPKVGPEDRECGQCLKRGNVNRLPKSLKAMQGDLQNFQHKYTRFQMMQDAMAQLVDP